MQWLSLEGLWLIGALGAMYAFGVFSAQWAKDKVTGLPAELRGALVSLETSAKNELAAAKAKVVADTATLLTNAKAKVASDLTPKPSPAPVLTTLDQQPVVVTPAPVGPTPALPFTPLA